MTAEMLIGVDEFDHLVAAHRRDLHAHSYRMLGSVHDADDALQETLVKREGGALHRAPSDIPGVGRFSVVADPQGAVFTLFRGDGTPPPDLPPVGHTAPVPRRIRAVLAGQVVLDTTSALYVWEWTHYPAYYVPVADIDPAALVDEEHSERLERGIARSFALRAGDVLAPAATIWGSTFW